MNTWWSLGSLRGIPVRMHWTVIAGLLFFSGLRFAPGAWLGFLAVILIHELGHAGMVRLARQHVYGIDIHGLGGECRWAGNATAIQRALIAWGGVLAQLALFIVALPLSWFVGNALGSFGRELFYALTWSSLMIAAINLIPIQPFDGAEAWRLIPLLGERWRKRRPRPAPPKGRSEAASARTAKGGTDRRELGRLFSQLADEARDARRPRRD